MIEKYDYIRKEIIRLINSGNYADSNRTCYEFIEMLLFNSNNINDDLWFCYYMIAYNYYMMGMYALAIENGKYAAFVTRNYNPSNYNKTILLIASCYKDKEDSRKAVIMYKQCARYYKRTNNDTSRASCLYSIARLLNMNSVMIRLEKWFDGSVSADMPGLL